MLTLSMKSSLSPGKVLNIKHKPLALISVEARCLYFFSNLCAPVEISPLGVHNESSLRMLVIIEEGMR